MKGVGGGAALMMTVGSTLATSSTVLPRAELRAASGVAVSVVAAAVAAAGVGYRMVAWTLMDAG